MNEKKRIFRFLEDDRYVKYFCKKYSLLSKNTRKEVSDLEVKMNKYVSMQSPYTPNYELFISDILSDYKHPIIPSEIECSIDLCRDVEKYSYFYIILICLARLKDKSGNSNIILQKIKLILGLCSRDIECKNLITWYMAKVDAELSADIPEDIKELSSIELKAHFFTALKMNQLSKAARILGAYQYSSNENSKNFLILDGYVNFMDENYSGAMNKLYKIDWNNLDYNPSIWLKLEILSLEGNVDSFLQVINESNVGSLDYWQLKYCQMELLLNNTDPNFSFEDFCQKIVDFNTVYEKSHGSNYYSYRVINLILSVCNELIDIYEDIEIYKYVNQDIIENEKLNKRICLLKNVLRIYSSDLEILTTVYSETSSFNVIKEKLIVLCANIFSDESTYLISEDTELIYLKEYILFLIRCHKSDLESEVIFKYIGEIEEAFNKDNQNAREIIASHCMQKVLDNQNDFICDKYLKSIENESFLADIETKKIYNNLSKKAKLAFLSAEWQFSKSQEEDYGWKDAGLLSLGYYRIIELELNERIVIPLFDNIGKQELQSIYYRHYNQIKDENKKEAYSKKWGTNLETFRKICDNPNNCNFFMLGNIDYLFKCIGSRFDENDPLAVKIRDTFLLLLTKNGKEAADKNYFEDIIDYNKRNEYRNPPAHVKYLRYEKACECREFVYDTLLKLNEYIDTAQ